MKARYAIVRVDGKCPDEFEKIDVQFTCRNLSCYAGKECYKNFYGDTKKQMILKVAQARYRQELKKWWKLFKQEGIKLEATYERCLREAKEIVEFLGVEE